MDKSRISRLFCSLICIGSLLHCSFLSLKCSLIRKNLSEICTNFPSIEDQTISNQKIKKRFSNINDSYLYDYIEPSLLQSSKSSLSKAYFMEKFLHKNHFLKEYEEVLSKPCLFSKKSLQEFLSHIEGVNFGSSFPKENRPHFITKELRITTTKNNFLPFEVNCHLIKRCYY